MKKLILCEGKHDRIFFEKLFTKMNIPASEVRFFDQETRDKLRDLRDAESKELMKFSEEYNPYKILVKSEAGENKAIKIFSRYLSYCIEKRQKDIEKTILMLDLDKNQSENRLDKKRLRKNMIKKKLSELEQMINAKRVGGTVYIETKTIEETDLIYLAENKLKTKESKKQIGKPFYLILFVYSLEDEANKIHPLDDISIGDKISKFVEKTNIHKTFSLIFT